MGGVKTSLIFVPVSASVSELIQGVAVKETLLRGGEERCNLIKKFVVDGARVGDSGAVLKELRGIATKLFNGEEVLKLPK